MTTIQINEQIEQGSDAWFLMKLGKISGSRISDLLSEGREPLILPNLDRKSTRLNSSHIPLSRMPSSA